MFSAELSHPPCARPLMLACTQARGRLAHFQHQSARTSSITLGAMSALLSQNKSFGRAWHSIQRRTPGMALLWMGRCDRRDDICDQPTYPLEVPRRKRSYCGVSPCCGESHDWDRNLSFIRRPGTFIVWPSASTIKRSHSLHRQRDSCTVAMILWLTVLRSHYLERLGWSLVLDCQWIPPPRW